MTDPRPRAAFVTGGSGGIGTALASMLVEEGYAVSIVGRRVERLAAIADTLRAAGGTVLEVSADLTDADAIGAAVTAHRERFGRLDVLVNNAGVALASKAGRQQPDAMREVLAIDLLAVLLLYRETLDMLQEASTERGRAHVINLASLTARYPQPWLAVYSATKAAVLSFTQSMNQAYAKKGILSTAVCPGFVDTDMSDAARGITRDEMIAVEDIAEVVRTVLRLSPRSFIPEIHMARPSSADPSGL